MAILTISFSAFPLAESYGPVRVETGIILPFEFGNFKQSGFGIIIEPKLNITDNLSVGLRAHWGLMLGGRSESATAMICYMLKADYFFNTNEIRPYVTFGLGLNPIASAYTKELQTWNSYYGTYESENENVSSSETFFSIFPGAGINLGSFRFGVGMNFVFAKQYTSMVYDKASYTSVYTGKEFVLRPQLIIDVT